MQPDEDYTICSNCSVEVETNDTSEHPETGDDLCDDCANDILRVCGWCNIECEPAHHDSRTGNDICTRCYDEHSINCEVCGMLMHKNDGHWMEHADGYFCGSCYEDEYSSHYDCDSNIQEFDYKPTPIFHNTDSSLGQKDRIMYMGVELEVEAYDANKCTSTLAGDCNDYGKGFLYCKDDGSLDDGFEIVSHPATLRYHRRKFNWTPMLDSLRKEKVISHNAGTCGIHVHVNLDFFQDAEKVNLGMFIYTQQNRVEKIARRCSDDWSKFSKKEKLEDYAHNEDRYEALNWTSRTVEFRFFKGTLKRDTFNASLEFVDSVCKFIKTQRTETLADIEQGWTAYTEWLKARPDYRSLKHYLKTLNIY